MEDACLREQAAGRVPGLVDISVVSARPPTLYVRAYMTEVLLLTPVRQCYVVRLIAGYTHCSVYVEYVGWWWRKSDVRSRTALPAACLAIDLTSHASQSSHVRMWTYIVNITAPESCSRSEQFLVASGTPPGYHATASFERSVGSVR